MRSRINAAALAVISSAASAQQPAAPKEQAVTVFGVDNALWDWCGQTNVGPAPDAGWFQAGP